MQSGFGDSDIVGFLAFFGAYALVTCLFWRAVRGKLNRMVMPGTVRVVMTPALLTKYFVGPGSLIMLAGISVRVLNEMHHYRAHQELVHGPGEMIAGVGMILFCLFCIHVFFLKHVQYHDRGIDISSLFGARHIPWDEIVELKENSIGSRTLITKSAGKTYFPHWVFAQETDLIFELIDREIPTPLSDGDELASDDTAD